MRSALIHTGQKQDRSRTSPAARNAQGEYDRAGDDGTAVYGPTFRCRVLAPPPGNESRDRPAGRSRAPKRYEVLADYETLVVPAVPLELTAADRLRCSAGPLGTLELEVDGPPEKLNDGQRVIGWRAFAVLVTEGA